MVRIALDPTPYHHDFGLLEFPEVAARLGYEFLQLTLHVDFTPFFRYPKADDALVAKLKKAQKIAKEAAAKTAQENAEKAESIATLQSERARLPQSTTKERGGRREKSDG